MLVAVFVTAFGSHIARVGDSELRPAEDAAVIPSRPTAVRCTVGRAKQQGPHTGIYLRDV